MQHLTELQQLSPATLRGLICNYALAVKNQRRVRGSPLWSVVMTLCSVGSTSAHELCKRANLVPSQHVGPKLTDWYSFQILTIPNDLPAD